MPALPDQPPRPITETSPRLALLHGWGLGPQVWSAALSALSPTEPERLPLPGYGGTPGALADFTTHATHLAAALPEGSVLCGWSLGALLALQAASLRPGHLRGLILVGATPCFMQTSGWPQAQPAEVLKGFAQAVAQSPDLALQRFAALVHQGDAQARALTRSSQQQLRATLPEERPSTDTLLHGLAWLRDIDLRPALATLHLPCLLLHGAEDALVPLAAAQALAATLPQARLAVLPRAAHAPFLSDPAWFGAQVQAFCSELTPGEGWGGQAPRT